MKLIFLFFIFLLMDDANAGHNPEKIFPVTTGYFSSFDGTKIYYEVHGSGKPVLLVHGFIVNMNSWKGAALYKDLLNDGYQVILLDLRGNGKSDKPHSVEAYANDAEAKDILGLMNHLKIKKYSVVGYSTWLYHHIEVVVDGQENRCSSSGWHRYTIYQSGMAAPFDVLPCTQG